MQHFPSATAIGRSLREPSVWSQIQQRLRAAWEGLTTNIGQAAKIVEISEPQLRYWEELGLLTPERAILAESNRRHPGQRRYGMSDLTRMVIIKELLDQQYSLAEIAAFMEHGYAQLEPSLSQKGQEGERDPVWIAEHGGRTEDGLFWRFSIPRILYYSICLLSGGLPTGNCTLVLPIDEEARQAARESSSEEPERLGGLGKTLLGNHTVGHPFTAFLAPASNSSRTPERTAVITLAELASEENDTGARLVVEQHLADLFTLPEAREPRALKQQAAKTVLALLRRLQADAHLWLPSVDQGSDVLIYNAVDPAFPSPRGDRLLVGLTELVVRAGGKRSNTDEDRWKFAAILLAADPTAPLQQQSLVVSAQSARAPYIVGVTTLPPGATPSLCSRAFQSGQAIYRPHIEKEDTSIFLRKLEGDIDSAIALPIEGQNGQLVAVLYIVSDEPDAFTNKVDQVLLRVIGKMVGELVSVHMLRKMMTEHLTELTQEPLVVDNFFREFASENEFMLDVDELFKTLIHLDESKSTNLALIGVDIDDLSGFTEKYGEQAAKNLVRSVGRRIKQWMNGQPSKSGELHLYRIWADRFYLVMKGVSQQSANAYAEQLQNVLREPHRIDASRISARQSLSSASGIDLRITVRLGVISYASDALKAMVDASEGVARLRERLMALLDQALSLGQAAGGDAITTWDSTVSAFASRRYQESESRSLSNHQKKTMIETLTKLVTQL